MSKMDTQVETRKVPLADIVGNQFERHTPESVKQRAQDMAVNGLLQPIGVMEGKPMRLLFGHGRVLSARLLGWTEILTRVFPATLSATEQETLALAENWHRLDETPWEKHQRCVRLSALNPGWKGVDLARHTNLDPGMITRLLAPSKMVPALQDAFKAGLLSLEDCYTCSRLDEAAQHEFLAAKTNKGNVSEVVRRARHQKNGKQDIDRVKRVSIPLPGGRSVTLAGTAIGMAELVDGLADALKEARKCAGLYDVRTFVSMMRDRVKKGGD